MITKTTLSLLIAIVLSACTLFAQTSPITAQPPSDQPGLSGQFSYQGFAIDDTAMIGDPDRDAVKAEVQKQIDEIVSMGLSSEVFSFFQTIPIQVRPAMANNSSGYDLVNKTIYLTEKILPYNDQRNLALLNCLLCQLLRQKNPNGTNNIQIAAYFQSAQNGGIYNADSSMMSDVGIFFIETSLVYLFGWDHEEPMSREKLKQNQPDYVAYLHALYGPASGSYNGSLVASFSHDNGFSYKRFFIDDSLLQDMPYRDEMRAAIKNQIDVVEGVGLPDEVIAFFQALPIKVVPDHFTIGDCGEYDPWNNVVYLQHSATPFLDNGLPKVTLLHECLHAYHREVLLHSWKNPEILAFYQAAQALMNDQNNYVYDPNSHMMSDVGEYFACSASTYMFGTRQEEPFSREKVEESQPDYVAYLHMLFGPNIGRYQPSLAPFLLAN